MKAMALEAESAHVAQIAFTATFRHRYNVVGIPKRFAALQAPRGDSF
jgi:hypothetical protein